MKPSPLLGSGRCPPVRQEAYQIGEKRPDRGRILFGSADEFIELSFELGWPILRLFHPIHFFQQVSKHCASAYLAGKLGTQGGKEGMVRRGVFIPEIVHKKFLSP